MSEVTETTILGVLMRHVLARKNHILVLPNSNTFFGSYEADLISITRSLVAHEYEIKLNLADFRRDALKHKHNWFQHYERGPAYFWYVTYSFQIEPPEYAGWININKDSRGYWQLDEKKKAPRLNQHKVTDREQFDVGRLLSWRIANYYGCHTAIPIIPDPQIEEEK